MRTLSYLSSLQVPAVDVGDAGSRGAAAQRHLRNLARPGGRRTWRCKSLHDADRTEQNLGRCGKKMSANVQNETRRRGDPGTRGSEGGGSEERGRKFPGRNSFSSPRVSPGPRLPV